MTLAHLLLFLFLFVAVLALYVLYVVVRRSGEDKRVLPMIKELKAETTRLHERLTALERHNSEPADA